MTARLLYRAQAAADLAGLFDFLHEHAGPERAERFLGDIETTCRRLLTFPQLGRARNDLSPGIRTISMQRRVVIAYRIRDPDIEIVTIVYAGRDWEGILRDDEA